MRLDRLMTKMETQTVTPAIGAMDIQGLTADSRGVGPGWLFAALPGSQVDGQSFIPDALDAGAKVILAAPGARLPANTPHDVVLLTDPNPRRAFAWMAAAFHGHAQPRAIAAVTGTNGKTSTVTFARQMWDLMGHSGASLGTIGAFAKGLSRVGAMTTPDPATFHATLAELAKLGVTHLAMEASSHGLDQYRSDGARVMAAAFTNLTRDHLDYHGDMAAYLAAKTRLFTEVLEADGTAVLNADAPEFEGLAALCRARGQKILSFGHGAGADLRLVERRPAADGQALTLDLLDETHHLHLPLAGDFQAMNVLCALGLVLATTGMDRRAIDTLPQLEGVPGRLELVASRANGAPVYVDYAHTPDALETVLKALRPHCAGRLVCVFGCGGDRDRGKRPLMGAVSAELADLSIVTDDNPRSEDPAAIRAEVLARCPEAREIGDRAKAIAAGVQALEPGDLLLIAGKGHETGQTVKGVVHPFVDHRVALTAVREADA